MCSIATQSLDTPGHVNLTQFLSTLFTTAQLSHSREIVINQKILPIDQLINQQEAIVAHKVNQWNVPAERLSQSCKVLGMKSKLEIKASYVIIMASHSQIFVRYRDINTWNS